MNERERRDILTPEVRVNKWFKLEVIQRALLSQSSVALYRRWIAFFRFCSSPHNTRGDQHPRLLILLLYRALAYPEGL